MNAEYLPNVEAAVQMLTDPSISNDDLLRRLIDIYSKLVSDVDHINDASDCEQYISKFEEISNCLEKLAREDDERYRYFIYGMFQGQISVMRMFVSNTMDVFNVVNAFPWRF